MFEDFVSPKNIFVKYNFNLGTPAGLFQTDPYLAWSLVCDSHARLRLLEV